MCSFLYNKVDASKCIHFERERCAMDEIKTSGSNPSEETASELLLSTCMRFVKLSRMLELKLDQCPAHMARLRLMLALVHGNDNTLPELSRETCVSASSLCLMLKQLDKEGFVNRITCPTDARITLYSLTPKGHAWLHDEYLARQRAMAELVRESLSSEECSALASHLTSIHAMVQALTCTCKAEDAALSIAELLQRSPWPEDMSGCENENKEKS